MKITAQTKVVKLIPDGGFCCDCIFLHIDCDPKSWEVVGKCSLTQKTLRTVEVLGTSFAKVGNCPKP